MSVAAPICAFVYEDGVAVQDVLVQIVARARTSGLHLAGTIQIERPRADRRKCDMMLENLATGAITKISEDRGDLASGCRLDRDAFARVEAAVRLSIEQKPALVVVNKFGKTEIEGGGLRGVIADAIMAEVPALVGVPKRNLDEWTGFAGEHANEAHDANAVFDWLRAAGLSALAG